MAGFGEGIVVPATIVVSITGLDRAANEIRSFASRAGAGYGTERPRVSGGMSAAAASAEAAPAQTRLDVRAAAVQARLLEQAQMRTEAGQKVVQQEIQLAAEEAELKASIAQRRASDKRLIKATADAANAREQEAARVSLQRAGIDWSGLSGVELQARTAVAKRVTAENLRAETLRQTAKAELGAVDAIAATKVEEAKLRVAIRAREKDLMSQAIKSEPGIRGTSFQRVQARLSASENKLPEEYLTGPQYFGEKFQRTLGFAVSGFALGAGVAAITQMFKDATELEQTFVRLRGQMESIGQTDAFSGVRDQIREIAQETGQASNVVGTFYSRMLGLSQDPAKAAEDSTAAMKMMTVTGLDVKTMEQSLIPVQKAFGVSAEEVGDKVVAMGEKFGLPEDDLLQFLGKTAASAKNAGLSLDELVTIGATMANSLGKPISSSAEALQKMFTNIEANRDKIFDIMSRNPATAGAIPEMIKQIGAGETGKALLTLAKASKEFTAAQRESLLKSIVSKRESEEFNAFFSNVDSIFAQLEGTESSVGDTTGRLQERFDDLRETVGVTFKSIAASFESIGDSLFRAGLSDVLIDLGNALSVVVKAGGGFIAMFAKLNEVATIGGVPIISVVGRMALLTAVLVKGYGLLASAKNLSSRSSDDETASETRNIANKERLSASATQAAASEGRLAAAKISSGTASAASAGTMTGGMVGGLPYTVTGGGKVAAGRAAAAAEQQLVWNAALGRYQGAKGQMVGFKAAEAAGHFEHLPPPPLAAARNAEATAARTAARADLGVAAASTAAATQTGRMADQSGRTAAAFKRMQARLTAIPDRISRGFEDVTTVPYAQRRERYLTQFTEQRKAGTFAAPGLSTRALSGGDIIRSAKADAASEVAGMKQGVTPGWGIAIAIAGAAVVKSAVDQQRENTQKAADDLKRRLERADASQLKALAGERDNMWTRISAVVLGTPRVENLIRQETSFDAANVASRIMGGPIREQAKGAADRTATTLASRTAEVNKKLAGALNPDSRKRLVEDFKKYPELMTKAIEMGLMEVRYNQAGQQSVEVAEDAKLTTDKFEKLISESKNSQETWANQFRTSFVGVAQAQGNMTTLLAESAKTDAATKAKVALENNNQTVDQYIMSLEGDTDKNYKSIETLRAEFQAGQITQGEFVAQLQRRLPRLKQEMQGFAGTPYGDQAAAAFAAINKEVTGLMENSASYADDLVSKFKVAGSTRPKRTQATLHAATMAKKTLDEQYKELPALIQEETDAAQAEFALIADPTERTRAMNEGVQLSAYARATFFRKMYADSGVAQTAVQSLATAAGRTTDAISNDVINTAAEDNVSLAQAAASYMDERIEKYKKMADAAEARGDTGAAKIYRDKQKQLEGQRQAFIDAFSSLPELPDTAPSAEQQQINEMKHAAARRQAKGKIALAQASGSALRTTAINAAEAGANYQDVIKLRSLGQAVDEQVDEAYANKIAADRAQADAFFDYTQLVRNRAVILAQGDPVAENQAQMGIALAALSRATQTGDPEKREQAVQQIMQLQLAARENQLNIIRGAMAITAARDAEDPTRAALDALRQAEFELANAKGLADREQKEAAVITARRSLQNTISAGIAADAQLAISLANLRDDPIEAARIAAQEAVRKLQEAQAKGITDRSVLAPLEQQAAETQKQIILSTFNKQIEDLDWLHDMDQMSMSSYVAGLEAVLSTMQVGSKEYKDLALKIYGLKKSAGQDLAFNIPGNLELPTLYEARRAASTVFKWGGGPYQDNRNISVSIAVNGAQDPITIANQVASAVSQSIRGGSTYTPGIPVGAGA